MQTAGAVATVKRLELEATISAFHGRLEPHPVLPHRFCVPRGAAPTTQERQQLCDVRARLEAQLEPCHDELAIEAVVGQYLLGYEQGRGGSDLNTAALNGRYVKALSGFPLAAIQAAVDRLDSARPLIPRKPTFRPNPAEMAEEVRAGTIAVRARLVHVRQVLEAEVYDPPTEAQKAKVAAAAAEFLKTRRVPLDDRGDAFNDGRTIEHEPVPGRAEERERQALAQQLAGLREAGTDPGLGRLMSNLDRRQAAR
ncbi:hypothetical protein [Methylobacterium iners]|uniref:Uncharacterized protein n=1 Tax=Methylobacterium iners TaxID=418707 RepID=A0ABQ4RRR7_9HYPH|nr:hypothetical protein [Methylobacterium iners]GJD92899.1 hypothetical protein OCOJLMKI_0082 [Methylobacterium iners]